MGFVFSRKEISKFQCRNLVFRCNLSSYRKGLRNAADVFQFHGFHQLRLQASPGLGGILGCGFKVGYFSRTLSFELLRNLLDAIFIFEHAQDHLRVIIRNTDYFRSLQAGEPLSDDQRDQDETVLVRNRAVLAALQGNRSLVKWVVWLRFWQ